MSLGQVQLFVLILPPLLYAALALWIRPPWKIIGLSPVGAQALWLAWRGSCAGRFGKIARKELRMNKRSIIDQIKAHGAVAAHTTGRYVDIVNRVPVKVVMATPIYMGKEKLRKGDKVAIVDMDENVAFICTVGQATTSRLSKIQTLTLDKAKKIKLE